MAAKISDQEIYKLKELMGNITDEQWTELFHHNYEEDRFIYCDHLIELGVRKNKAIITPINPVSLAICNGYPEVIKSMLDDEEWLDIKDSVNWYWLFGLGIYHMSQVSKISRTAIYWLAWAMDEILDEYDGNTDEPLFLKELVEPSFDRLDGYVRNQRRELAKKERDECLSLS